MGVRVTTENFESQVLHSRLPVLVDFWAPWCGPCKAITPHIEELAKDLEGKLKICKLNVDEAPEIATKYTVMSIPTLMIFKDGKAMDKRVGAMKRNDLRKFIHPYIIQK
ncbi:MAG: thioredoxin [Candidatus Omnitrophota bacterium]|nr:MAG: thioredoxin [Candidatus Omnitrophota bacterium]